MPSRRICNLSAKNVGLSHPRAIVQPIFTPMIVVNDVYPALDDGRAGLP